MTNTLWHLLRTICHVYLNDIIIWSNSIEKHEANITKVLKALQAAKLYCNIAKSVLFATEI